MGGNFCAIFFACTHTHGRMCARTNFTCVCTKVHTLICNTCICKLNFNFFEL